MNSKPIDGYTVTILPGTANNPGATLKQCPGSFFLCRSASAPFMMQFDASSPFPCEAGFQTGGKVGTFRAITFFNPNPYPITVRYYVGGEGVGFSGTILAQNLDTYTYGNLGSTAQYIQVNRTSYPSGLTVPGLNNGNKRKTLYIGCYSGLGNATAAMIKNLSGQTVFYVPVGTTMQFESNDTFIIDSGSTNNAWVTIGEVYYAA